MLLKLIPEKKLPEVYEDHMVRDFPENELKPLSMLIDGMRKGYVRPYGLYDGGILTAYAILLCVTPGEAGILDYLGTVRPLRNKGYGGEILRQLRETITDCAGLLIEYECPHDAPDETEREIRLRREAFYLKNGARPTDIDLVLFGVHYNMGYLPFTRDLPDAELQRMQTAIYDAIHSWDYHFRPLSGQGGK